MTLSDVRSYSSDFLQSMTAIDLMFMSKRITAYRGLCMAVVTLWLLTSGTYCYATPSIDSVSGSVTQGDSITLYGLNFGTKSPARPLVWADFEGDDGGGHTDEDDDLSVSSLTISNMSSNWSSIPQPHSNSSYYIGGANRTTGGKVTTRAYNTYDGSTGRRWYTFKRRYFTSNFWDNLPCPPGTNIKWDGRWMAGPGGSGCVNFYPMVYSNSCLYDKDYCMESGPTQWGSISIPPAGRWLVFEYQLDQGTLNSVNGSIEYWRDVDDEHTVSSSFNLRCTACNEEVRTVDTHVYLTEIERVPLNAGNAVDDLYIDNTWARVMIGDNSNFDSCTQREIQIPTAWAMGEITVTIKQGSFHEGDQVFVFVVDSEGSVSDGYPVVLGGTAEDNEAPYTSGHTPPNGSTDVASDSNVIVHVQDGGDGVEQSSIVMTVNGQPVNPSISGGSADYTVTYDPPDDFAEGQEVTITINARDLHDPPNVMPQDSYSFAVAAAPDTTNPLINIAQPTSGDTYSTDQNAMTLSGSASDDVGVASVNWANSRGGNGTASGTTNWTSSNIPLQEGNNVITVTAHDAAGNTGTDMLAVTYTPPPGTYTEEFGSATGTDHPGTLQDTHVNLDTTNYSSAELLKTYTWPQDQVANAIIMKWDLSAIPSSANVQDATLYLDLANMDVGGGDELYDISVHTIINYNPVISVCTGYTYDGTNSWTPNSQCYNNIPLAQADIAPVEDMQSIDKTYGYKSWSVTNMVQDWVSNPASNYGMLLNSDPVANSNSNRYFSSTESSNPDQRPKLVVTYTVGEIPDTEPPAPPEGLTVELE